MTQQFKVGWIYLVMTLVILPIIHADTNGVWHQAEDVRGGVFGNDEQSVTSSYAFVNPVVLQEVNITGLPNCERVFTDANGRLICGTLVDNNATNELQDLQSVLQRGDRAGGLKIRNAGQIGINTSFPSSILDVNGETTTDSLKVEDLGSCNALKTTTNGSVVCDNTSSDPPLGDVLSSGNDAMGRDIINAGDIGIGTGSPRYPLDVQGDARISGDLIGGGPKLDFERCRSNEKLKWTGSRWRCVNDRDQLSDGDVSGYGSWPDAIVCRSNNRNFMIFRLWMAGNSRDPVYLSWDKWIKFDRWSRKIEARAGFGSMAPIRGGTDCRVGTRINNLDPIYY